MFLVGLTGGIASGKSVASKFFHEHGVRVIDSDSIAREVVQPGTSTYRRLRNEFGPDFFDETSGQLRREKLGDLIFNDAEQRRKLNAIVHPAIRRQIVLQTLGSLLTFERFVVVDIPLLFESKLEGFFQKIVVVHCTEENQVRRLCRRDGISEEQARARIAAQLPAAYKIERATFALDNNGNLEQLHAQLKALLVQLEASWIPLAVRSVLGAAVLLAAVFAFRLWS